MLTVRLRHVRPAVLNYEGSSNITMVDWHLSTATQIHIQYNLSIPNLAYSKIRLIWTNGLVRMQFTITPYKITLCIPNPVHSEFQTYNWVPWVHNCFIWHPVFRSICVDLTQAKGTWMFVWYLNEIIDLLLCGIHSFVHYNSWIICICTLYNRYKVPKSFKITGTCLLLISQT